MKNTNKPKSSVTRRVHTSTVRIANYGLFAFWEDSNGGSFADKNEQLLRAMRLQVPKRKVGNRGQ